MDKPPFNDLAQPNMSEEERKFVDDAVKLITEQYGDVLKRLSKT